MIIPISYFDLNNGQPTTHLQRIQSLIAQGATEITVTELGKTYATTPESQIALMQDITWYFDNVLANTTTRTNHTNRSKKSWTAALLLNIFLGGWGAHRFYVGKIGTGLAQLLTFGGLGIWVLVDFILILTGNFKDSEGNVVQG
jgi:TM2 domain-containing membrane protein YozV